jgi:hypothetical protein
VHGSSVDDAWRASPDSRFRHHQSEGRLLYAATPEASRLLILSVSCVSAPVTQRPTVWDFPRSFITVFRLAASKLCRTAATQIAEFDSEEVWGWEVRKRSGIMMPKIAIGLAAAAMAVGSALGASADYGSRSLGHYKSGIFGKRSEGVKHANWVPVHRVTKWVPRTFTKMTLTRMEPRTFTRMVPLPSTRMVPQTFTRMVPQTFTKMVPRTSTRMVPQTYTKMEPRTFTKMEPRSFTKLEPRSFTKMEPRTFTRMEPRTVSKLQQFTKLEPRTFTKMEPRTFTKLEPRSFTTWRPKTLTKYEPVGQYGRR